MGNYQAYRYRQDIRAREKSDVQSSGLLAAFSNECLARGAAERGAWSLPLFAGMFDVFMVSEPAAVPSSHAKTQKWSRLWTLKHAGAASVFHN